MNAASYYHGDCRPKKPDMTIDVRSSLKDGVVVLSRPFENLLGILSQIDI